MEGGGHGSAVGRATSGQQAVEGTGQEPYITPCHSEATHVLHCCTALLGVLMYCTSVLQVSCTAVPHLMGILYFRHGVWLHSSGIEPRTWAGDGRRYTWQYEHQIKCRGG